MRILAYLVGIMVIFFMLIFTLCGNVVVLLPVVKSSLLITNLAYENKCKHLARTFKAVFSDCAMSSVDVVFNWRCRY